MDVRTRTILSRRTSVPGIVALALFLVAAIVPVATAARVDRSFGTNGTVITKSGVPVIAPGVSGEYTGNAWTIVQDRYGRVLAGGGSGGLSMVTRYRRDGSLDPMFGKNGVSVFRSPFYFDDPTKGKARVKAMAVLPSGRIVLAIQSNVLTSIEMRATELVRMRLLPNGLPDQSFSFDFGDDPNSEMGPGYVGPAQHRPKAIALRPDGSFLIAGDQEWNTGERNGGLRGFVAAFKPDGRVDLDFGPRDGGSVRLYSPRWPWYSGIRGMIRLKSGKILVGGDSLNRFMVGRLTPGGLWDKTFGTGNGRTLVNLKNTKGKPCYCAVGYALAKDRKGRIYLSGWSSPDGSFKKQRMLNVLRFRPNGKIDRTFGKNGRTAIDVGETISVTSMSIHPNGKIYVTGEMGYRVDPRFAVFAFRSSGRVDRSFFNNGRYISRIGKYSTATDSLIDNKGRLVVSGGTDRDGDASFVVKRFIVK